MNCQPPIPDPAPGDGVTAAWGRAIARAIRSMRLSGGPGVSVRTTPAGTTVSAPRPRDERGGSGVEVPEYTPSAPAPVNPDGTGRYTVRVVVDWKYDTSDKKFKVLYGTLALVGGVLCIVPDTVVDGEGNIVPAWSDGSAGAPHGPLGGCGVQAVEESY